MTNSMASAAFATLSSRSLRETVLKVSASSDRKSNAFHAEAAKVSRKGRQVSKVYSFVRISQRFQQAQAGAMSNEE